MIKPSIEDIKALIEQAEKLKREVEQLKKKSFLTPVQSESIKAGTDTALYLLRLSYTNKKECWSNFGIVDSYFTLTGSLKSGRFAQNLGDRYADDYGEKPERIECYNPNKHTGLFARYDFDEKKFRRFLNQYTAKQRQLYWKNHIQPLIIQLDTDLTPWLPFMKPYIDTEGTQEAIKTAELTKLPDTIYEFKKIQKVVETEVKQKPAETEQESKSIKMQATQNLINENFTPSLLLQGIEKFNKLISDRQQVIEELENNNTNKDANKCLGVLNTINKELAIGGVAIYEHAVLLNLPTKPEYVLHLATNLGDNEEEKYISKAEDELLQLEIEAKTIKTDRNNKPAKIGQSQHAQTPPETELIEQIVARLKQWIQKHPHAKRIKPLDFHDVCYGLKVDLESATDGLNDILFYLRENGETGKAEAIEKLYSQLLHSVSVESHSRSDGLAPMYLELDSTKKLAALLARELQNVMRAETGKKIQSDKKPKAETWEQITIEVVDDDTIKYKVNDKKWKRANYTELGFLDKRKNRANKLWPIFLGLASKNLPSNINRPIMKSKDIDRIRDTLRKFFGIKKLPIKYNRRAKEYRCNFKFNDPRDWTSTTQNENLVD